MKVLRITFTVAICSTALAMLTACAPSTERRDSADVLYSAPPAPGRFDLELAAVGEHRFAVDGQEQRYIELLRRIKSSADSDAPIRNVVFRNQAENSPFHGICFALLIAEARVNGYNDIAGVIHPLGISADRSGKQGMPFFRAECMK